MDPLTHALAGAAIAQVGFRSKLGREAGWVAAFVACTPDLDIFVPRVIDWLGQPQLLDRLVYHRGPSHAILAVPILALLFALPWFFARRLAARRARRRQLVDRVSQTPTETLSPAAPAAPAGFGWYLGCCLAAVATHGLLDMCTSYGTQWYWPVSSVRAAWHCVPIIDLLLTPILLITVLACYVVRRLRTSRAASRVALVGLILAAGYLGAGRVAHNIALERGLAHLDRQQVLQAEAYPAMGSIFLWRVVAETQDGHWHATRIHLFADRDAAPRQTETQLRESAPTAMATIQKTHEYAIWNWFTDGKIRPEIHRDGAWTLIDLHDMRYGHSNDSAVSLWTLRFVINPAGEVVQTSRFTPPRKEPKDFINTAWQDLLNP